MQALSRTTGRVRLRPCHGRLTGCRPPTQLCWQSRQPCVPSSTLQGLKCCSWHTSPLAMDCQVGREHQHLLAILTAPGISETWGLHLHQQLSASGRRLACINYQGQLQTYRHAAPVGTPFDEGILTANMLSAFCNKASWLLAPYCQSRFCQHLQTSDIIAVAERR